MLDVDGEEGRALCQDDAVQKVTLFLATTWGRDDDVDISSLRKDGKLVQR
jgi:hypothetical protein